MDADIFEDADEPSPPKPASCRVASPTNPDDQFADAEEEDDEDDKSWHRNQLVTIHPPQQPPMTLVLSPPPMPAGRVPQPAGVLVLPLYNASPSSSSSASAQPLTCSVDDASNFVDSEMSTPPVMLTVEPNALQSMFPQVSWAKSGSSARGVFSTCAPSIIPAGESLTRMLSRPGAVHVATPDARLTSPLQKQTK